MTQELFIPPLGFELELAEDWTFPIYNEHRNLQLLSAAQLIGTLPHRKYDDFWQLPTSRRMELWEKSPWRRGDGSLPNGAYLDDLCVPLTLRRGSRLKVERIYIRQGQGSFDSVTFRMPLWVSQTGDPLWRAPSKTKSLRFWAKLGDVNRIKFKPVATSV